MRSPSLGFALTCAVAITGCAQAQGYSTQDAGRGAEVRANAEIIVPYLYAPCTVAEASPQKQRFDATLERYEALKASLADTSFEVDLAIVQADYDYRMSLVDILCPDPDDAATHASTELQLDIVDSSFERLELVLADLSEEED